VLFNSVVRAVTTLCVHSVVITHMLYKTLIGLLLFYLLGHISVFVNFVLYGWTGSNTVFHRVVFLQ